MDNQMNIFADVKFKEATFTRKQQVWDYLDEMIEKDQKARIIPMMTNQFLIKAVAAVVIGFVMIVGGVSFSNQEIYSGAQMASVQLPDGSDVTIYPQSSLKYNRIMWYINHNVNLDGKAYFQGNHSDHFTVKTVDGSVTVLGTKFMVDTQKDKMSVKCDEGKIRVTSLNGKSAELTAGQSAIVTSNEVARVAKEVKPVMQKADVDDEADVVEEPKQNVVKTTVANVGMQPAEEEIDDTKDTKNSSMQMQMYFFNNTHMNSVAKKLESVYHITINKKYLLDGIKYSGSFSDSDLEKALKQVFGANGIKYTHSSEDVIDIVE